MENSRRLLSYAMAALDEANALKNTWSIGGGTVLAHEYNHRMSKDIDVFIDDIQLLSSLSPRFNNQSECALDYEEMGNYVSLTFPEGKVDFIAGTQITEFGAKEQEFLGRNVRLDDPVEIVAKKLYYRGEQALPRDIFDLAVVYDSKRKMDLINTALSMPDKIEKFNKCFKKQWKNPNFTPYSKAYEDMLLSGCEKIKGKEFEICDQFVCCIEKIQAINNYNVKVPTKFSRLDQKEAFVLAAKNVLKCQNGKWTESTPQKIAEELYLRGCNAKKIRDCMGYSPIPIHDIRKLTYQLFQLHSI